MLINRVAVKRFILECCELTRPSLGITRVSGTALNRIEAELRQKLERLVWSHPANGKTFNP